MALCGSIPERAFAKQISSTSTDQDANTLGRLVVKPRLMNWNMESASTKPKSVMIVVELGDHVYKSEICNAEVNGSMTIDFQCEFWLRVDCNYLQIDIYSLGKKDYLKLIRTKLLPLFELYKPDQLEGFKTVDLVEGDSLGIGYSFSFLSDQEKQLFEISHLPDCENLDNLARRLFKDKFEKQDRERKNEEGKPHGNNINGIDHKDQESSPSNRLRATGGDKFVVHPSDPMTLEMELSKRLRMYHTEFQNLKTRLPGSLYSELVCSVCLDVYSDPISLMCGHSYCRVCIHQIYSAGHRLCPECRADFTEMGEFNPNVALKNILLSMESTNKSRRDQIDMMESSLTKNMSNEMKKLAFFESELQKRLLKDLADNFKLQKDGIKQHPLLAQMSSFVESVSRANGSKTDRNSNPRKDSKRRQTAMNAEEILLAKDDRRLSVPITRTFGAESGIMKRLQTEGNKLGEGRDSLAPKWKMRTVVLAFRDLDVKFNSLVQRFSLTHKRNTRRSQDGLDPDLLNERNQNEGEQLSRSGMEEEQKTEESLEEVKEEKKERDNGHEDLAFAHTDSRILQTEHRDEDPEYDPFEHIEMRDDLDSGDVSIEYGQGPVDLARFDSLIALYTALDQQGVDSVAMNGVSDNVIREVFQDGDFAWPGNAEL